MIPTPHGAPSGRAPSDAARRVLVLGYAFPPIHVQMSPVTVRVAAGLHTLGFTVDIICADPDVWPLPRDNSLEDYATAHCHRIQRLVPTPSLTRRLAHRVLPRLRDLPDCMEQLRDSAFSAVMASDPESYAGVITVSPFHSVNPVMARVKRAHPNLTWIAHFCDPWGGNPLEHRCDVRWLNAWREPRSLCQATFVTHSSPQALEQVAQAYPFLGKDRTRVVPHVFDSALYPTRPKPRNDRLTLCYIGTLFGRRTPTPVLLALGQVLERRPDLRDALQLDLVGMVEAGLLDGPASSALPPGMVRQLPPVPYRDSLALMYDADILLVIEADIAGTPFVPSKVTDYMGANTPIVGLVPQGGARDILERLGCPTAAPHDIGAIAVALEGAIDAAAQGRERPWCDDTFRRSFELTSGAQIFASLLGGTRS